MSEIQCQNYKWPYLAAKIRPNGGQTRGMKFDTFDMHANEL